MAGRLSLFYRIIIVESNSYELSTPIFASLHSSVNLSAIGDLTKKFHIMTLFITPQGRHGLRATEGVSWRNQPSPLKDVSVWAHRFVRPRPSSSSSSYTSVA
jgi:hypothetical protein